MGKREMSTDAPRIVRTEGSTALFVTITVIAVIGLGSLAFGEFSLRGLAIAGLPVALFTWVWVLYRFPRVELRYREIALVNPLKTITIPWNLVDGFDTRFGLRVITHTKSYSSWSLAGRGKRTEKDADGVRLLVGRPNPAVAEVVDHHARLSEEELSNPRGERTSIEVWNLPIILALVIAIAWAGIGIMALPPELPN